VSRIAKVIEALKDGPKTMVELRGLGLSKEAVHAARESGEVLADASTHDGRQFVAVYYLHPDQLKMRHDIRIYLSSTGLIKAEEEEITSYINSHACESCVWLGNAERELGLSLSGQSELCTRRRDYFLTIAKSKGLEVREGLDEANPTKGSKRWWENHANELANSVEEALKVIRLSPRLPQEADLLSFHEKGRKLVFGCRLGFVSYPDYRVSLEDDKLRRILRLPALEHMQSNHRDVIYQMLDEGAEHCRNALRITVDVWRAIVTIAEGMSPEEMSEVQMPTEIVYLTYHLLYLKAKGTTAGELHVKDEDKPTIAYHHPDNMSERILASATPKGRVSLERIAGQLNQLINDEAWRQRVSDSTREAELSDEKAQAVLTEIRKHVDALRANLLEGRCEICQGVTPGPFR